MGANIAGIYGAQIFRQDDAPRYRRGFLVNIGVLSFALIMAAVRFTDDRIRRRRGIAVDTTLQSGSTEEIKADPEDVSNGNLSETENTSTTREKGVGL